MPMPRSELIALFMAGVRAADPDAAVRAALADSAPRPDPGGRLLVVAMGKAARGMARAALDMLGTAPAEVLVITNAENAAPLEGARVMVAGHPVPDDAGLRAGAAVLTLLDGARAGDVVLALISGGASALVPAPVAGLSLADKAAVTGAMLGAGMDISAMNAVRQQLSALKGGGFLRAAAPARVEALILSDVIGDDLRTIASGPTAAALTTRAGAAELLRAAGVWEGVPRVVHAALARAEDDAPLPQAENRLIGSNRLSLAAMAEAAAGARIVSDALTGDVAEAAARIVATAAAHPAGTPLLALWGGETTVRLHGTGRGGRNQELALRVALAMPEGRGWRFLSGGTDGRDGPTEAAGGVVDAFTAARIDAAGGDAAALLANNDSHRALALAGDLLVTGGTGTNVADLQILSLDP